MYYLTSVAKVKEELLRRKKQQGLIRSLLDQHIESRFGIADYSRSMRTEIAKTIIGSPALIDDNRSHGMLARQVPGVCSEDVACYLLAQKLGVVPCSFAQTRDTFHSNSNDKLHRAKIPFISWSKKNKAIIQYQGVITSPQVTSYTDLDMIRMDRLNVGDITLGEYHRQMQHAVFSTFPEPYVRMDVSPAWGEFLARALEAKKQPSSVWRSGENNKDSQCAEYTAEEARNLIVRPSSKWYYHLYLSMFLDGTFVLFETYDDETSGMPEVRQMFEEEMKSIYHAVGFMPIVVKTTPDRLDTLYVNRHIIENPAQAAETLSRAHHWSDDTSAMTRWFEDQAIQFGRTP